jgi:predicted acetyltransferase
MALVLRELTREDENAFFEGLKEWEGEDLSWYTFAWKAGMDFPQMMAILDHEKSGVGLPEGRVPATMLYGFLSDQIVGRVNIRHRLNEKLSFRGGHLGYAVAPRFRGLGYGAEMFEQALPYCLEIGLKELMITCSDTNTPSWKLIERFGGQLRDKVWDDEDKQTIRRYWLHL